MKFTPLRALGFRIVDRPTIADLQWAKSLTTSRMLREVSAFGRGRAPAVRGIKRATRKSPSEKEKP